MATHDEWESCPHCPHLVDGHIAVQDLEADLDWHPADGQPYRCSQCPCVITVGPGDRLDQVRRW